MAVWRFVKQLHLWQLLRVIGLVLQYPLYGIPTLRATKRTMIICNLWYQKEHHKNGKANAFRHALWNVLIGQNVFKLTKNEEKSMIWTQKITGLHEKLAPNEPLAEAMDLHNNKVGRRYFGDLKDASEEKIVTFLIQKASEAKKINQIKEVKDHDTDLVYLSEK